MDVINRIQQLREQMQKHGIDLYIVPTADYHQSEYVGDYFKARAFLTGFTGSAGTAVITKDEACLWTDGRYFLQASMELEGTGIILQKSGEEGVPTILEYIKSVLPKHGVIGFDGRTVGLKDGEQYREIAKEKEGSICYAYDLVGEIWGNRPNRSMEPAMQLDLCYAGESVSKKLERVRGVMAAKGATAHIITSLDDIGWLLNLRGNDVKHFPLMLSYAVVLPDVVELYVDAEKLDKNIMDMLTNEQVHVFPYQAIYERVKNFTKEDCVFVDPLRMNYALFHNLPEDTKIVQEENPTILMKATKNEVELANIREAHIKDGVAVTKFMYWLKQNIGKVPMTECSASDQLEAFRAQQEGFLQPSFSPICGFGEHGAIIHYFATPETDATLEKGSFFLADTGGHYLQGSTDITRTFALGEVSDEAKRHFTTVAISNLSLANVEFLHGCTGINLDYVAREPFWRQHLNYNHGTGHGVGYLGNIHEPPSGFHFKGRPTDLHPLEANMVLTDEPGIYLEGQYGIRLENELVVRNGVKNAYGQFMYFETITFVPFDLDAIDPSIMTQHEKDLLNAYHEQVYAKIAPYLEEEERVWLQEYTRNI